MSQEIFDAIIPTTTSGNQLATILNDFKDAIVTGFSGTTRPSELDAGGYWIDTTNPTLWAYKLYTGVQDITIFSVNLNTGVATISSVDSSLQIVRISDDSVGPILDLLKEREANNGQTLDGDTLGEVQFKGTRDSGVNVITARIRGFSQDDTTATAQGSYITFEASTKSVATISEIMRVIDGKLGVGTTAPTDTIHAVGSAIKSENLSDDPDAAKIIIRKQRESGGGQVLDTNLIAQLDFNSTNQLGNEVENARIEVTATEDQTASGQSSKIVIKNKKVGEATFTDQITIEDEVTINTKLNTNGDFEVGGDLTVTGDLTVNGTTTTINTATLEVEDANILVNKNGDQATANASVSGLTVEMSDATDARIGYDSTKTSKFVVGEVGSEAEIATTTGSQTLTNKIIDTASIRTPSRSDVKQDTYANLVTYASSATNGQLVFATDQKKMYQVVDSALTEIGGAGVGGINYIENYSFEIDDSGWVEYADTAAESPTDGTGGSANITFTRTTSGVLRGDGSGLITKDAADRQGQGVSYDFTIDSADQAQVLRISFDYNTEASTTNYADGDIRVYVYDVFNSRLIEVIDRDLYASSFGKFVGTFQTSPDSTSYRLIFHVASPNPLAYTVIVDNVLVGPQTIVKGAIQTDIQTVPAANYGAFAGLVALSREEKWSREGEFLNWSGYINTTTAGATLGEISVVLPFDLSIDLTKKSVSGDNQLGICQILDSSTIGDNGIVISSAVVSNGIRFIFENGQVANSSTNLPTGMTYDTSDFIRWNVRIPILGWSSNVVLSEDAGNREIATLAYKATDNTGINPNNSWVKLTLDTVSFDTSASFNSSLSRIEIPETGYYDINAKVRFSGTNVLANRYRIAVNTNEGIEYPSQEINATAGTPFTLNLSELAFFQKGEYLELHIFGAGNNSVSTLTIGGGTNTVLSVAKRSSPQTIAASEVVAATYRTDSATNTIPTTFGLGTDIIKFEDLVLDTHNAYNTTTGLYTVPQSGYYNIFTSILTATFTPTLDTNALEIRIRINGGTICGSLTRVGSTSSTTVFGSASINGYFIEKGGTIEVAAVNSVATTVNTSTVPRTFLSIVKSNGVS